MARWLRRLGFGAIAIAILYAAAYLVVGMRASAMVEAELASIRERGEPVALEEMAPPGIPEEENAALHLVAASELIVEPVEEVAAARNRFLDAPFTAAEEDVERVRRWVATNEPAFAPLWAAVARNSCRFDVYDSTDIGGEGPKVLPFLVAGKLLVSRSLLRARDGDLEGAMEDTRAAFRLAGHVGSDPALVAVMVRIVIEGLALDALERVLRGRHPPEATRARLAAAIGSTDIREALKRAIIAERCVGISVFESLQGDGEAMCHFSDTGDGEPPLRLRLVPDPVFRLDEAHYLDRMARAVALLERPWREARAGWKALEADQKSRPWYALVSTLITTHFTNLIRKAESHRARLDMARLALGDDPAALTDPFTGRPYERRVAEDGSHELRSPGPDEDDPSDDLVWMLD